MFVRSEKNSLYAKLSGQEPAADSSARAVKTMSQLLADASEMSTWKDPGLGQVVWEIIDLAKRLELRLEEVLAAEHDPSEALLLKLLRCGDHVALRLVHANLQTGWPIPGRLERTEQFLRIPTGEPNQFTGFQVFGRGCTYVGEFLGQMRHGRGRLQYSRTMYYEGDFFHNQRHGLGVDEDTEGRPYRAAGIFIDDFYRGDPSAPRIEPPRSWFNPFKRSKNNA